MSRGARFYDLSIDRARGRVRRRVMSALGGLLVLFNILAAGMAGAAAQADTLPPGDRIVVCTGDGMVVLDPSGKPAQNQSAGKIACPFCLPLMQGHARAPDPVVALAPDRSALVPTRDHQVLRPQGARHFCAARPRAPPVL